MNIKSMLENSQIPGQGWKSKSEDELYGDVIYLVFSRNWSEVGVRDLFQNVLKSVLCFFVGGRQACKKEKEKSSKMGENILKIITKLKSFL
jgi:hypothetical protein